MNVDKMIERRVPRTLQYGVIQMMLFVMGMMLAVGVVEETGAVRWLATRCDAHVHNIWLMGVLAGVVGSVLDNFATALSFFSLYPVAEPVDPTLTDPYALAFSMNGQYWKVVAYCGAVAGNILAIGSMSGVALLKLERMPVLWYLRHVGWKAFLGWLAGLLVMLIQASVY
jgi:Na+/H+ antiporter NhaD/arsenite permease-like protein